MENLTVIGIDPPVSKNCGWSVCRIENDKTTLLEKFTQVLIHPKDDPTGLEDVYGMMQQLITKHRATIVCMERQLGGGFQFGRAKLNEFVGVIKLCCLRNKVTVVEVSPAHLKMVIAGHGQAPKEKIMANVVAWFGLADAGAEHECDAAAFTLTYLIDKGWTGYAPKCPYTEEERAVDKAAKAARKKKKEEREKAKAKAEQDAKLKSRKTQKV